MTSLTPTTTGFIATFNKPIDPSELTLYEGSSGGGIDDVLLTGPGSPKGSLIISPDDMAVTFVKTSNFTGVNFNPSTGVLAAGTYTVTLRSASNGFKDNLGELLDGTDDGNPSWQQLRCQLRRQQFHRDRGRSS